MNNSELTLRRLLGERILLLDGAMGTMIQAHGLKSEDFHGDEFSGHSHDQTGNNDLLTLTQPSVIASIHDAYLRSGSDIIETNTFNSNSISMADYGLEREVARLNKAAAQLARERAEFWSAEFWSAEARFANR